MAMNAIDSTGVSQRAIDAFNEWRDWLENENHTRHEWYLDIPFFRNQHDAEYNVQCLCILLPLLEIIRRSNPQKRTVSTLYGNPSDVAIDVVCDFLQQSSNLAVLRLLYDGPPQQCRLLLQSLHTNTSVKELTLCLGPVENATLWVSNLLRHKTDLISLRFFGWRFGIAGIADILPGLRHRHAHLQTLAFARCDIGDEGVRLVLEAIRDGDLPVLKVLDLSSNRITSDGLRCLAEQGPAALRRRPLTIKLDNNLTLFDDLESAQAFVQSMVVSDDMSLLDLHIGNCGEHMPTIIKACENDNCKLHVLDVSTDNDNHQQLIQGQLMESVPRMTVLRRLTCNARSFNDDNGPAIITALHHNTSIVEINTYDDGAYIETYSLIAPTLHRNVHLGHADSLLVVQPKTQMPIGSKSGIWALAFAKMGEKFYNDDEPEPESDDEEEEEEDDDDDGHMNDSSHHDVSSVEKQGSDGNLLDGDDEEDGNDDRPGISYGCYAGASAIFKILQKRHNILEKQLRRPPDGTGAGGQGVAQQLHQQDAPMGNDCDGGDTNNVLQIYTDAGERKRRRL